MKLRQKLAVALASAMVITSVPVVTMAASTNSLVKETLKVVKGDKENSTRNALKVKFTDNDGTTEEVFYLKLTNAEWNKDLFTTQFIPAGVEYTYQNDTTIKVKVDPKQITDKTAHLPILATATGGDATVEIVTMSGNTTVSKGSYVFATTSDTAVKVAVDGTIPTFYTNGTIADIVITEAMAGTLAGLTGDAKYIDLEIENEGFRFVNTDSAKISYEYGFDKNETAEVKFETYDSATGLRIELPAVKGDGMGQIRIAGLQVATKDKAPETGDFKVSVYGDKTETQTGVKVAEITSYGSKVEIKDADKVEVKAGETKTVKFSLTETEKTSFINGRDVEFKLDNGYIMDQKVDDKKKYDEEATIEAVQKAVKLTSAEATTKSADLTITGVTVEDKKVVGFTATMVATEAVDTIKVEMPVIGGLTQSGDVTVTISGRAMAEEVTHVITTIKEAFTVNTEAAVLKVGLQGQKAGKITIKETEKAMLNSGKDIVVTIPKSTGITLTSAPTVTVVEGDVKIGEVTIDTKSDDDNAIVTIPVQRTSRTAATIEIADFKFTTDRTVAEGKFDVKVGGKALTTTEQTLTLEGFLTIGTPNTEDLASNGLARGTAQFVIGEATYTANGIAKEMDAQSYIQDPGFTMVPVRYVAEAFGVKASDILFSNGTATIFAGNRTIQLTAGSNIAIVNGATVTMGTKVVVKEGRTYAPVGEIARILGISTNWDSATKTATFANK